MIGIVVVSHSRALAGAAVALAAEMMPAGGGPRVEVAAGLDETTFGTDAVAVADAITAADSPDGVLVLLDLGSAILSAEMALEFVDADLASRVRLSPAPLVEGLVAAVVTAAAGAGLDAVDGEARGALAGKLVQLGHDAPVHAPAVACDDGSEEPALTWRHVVTNPHGLHARPAAAFVGALAPFDAAVRVRNLAVAGAPVDGRSPTALATLGVHPGHEIEVAAQGPDAAAALESLRRLAETGFGEAVPPSAGPAPALRADGPAVYLAPDPPGAIAAAGPDEAGRLAAATDAVESFLTGLTGPGVAEIATAEVALLRDPALARPISRALAAGATAEDALAAATQDAEARLEAASSPYLRERAADLRSLRRLLLTALTGADLRLGTPGPGVLVLDELDFATAAQLDRAHTPGVVARRPGESGHGAIVARARGIAVATGVTDLIEAGQLLVIEDGRLVR